MSARNPGDDLGQTGQNTNDARATEMARNSPRTTRERMKAETRWASVCVACEGRGEFVATAGAETPKAAGDRVK